MNKELKQLQTKGLLKPRIYSFDEVREILKAERDKIKKMIDKEIERWEKLGKDSSAHKMSALYDLRKKL